MNMTLPSKREKSMMIVLVAIKIVTRPEVVNRCDSIISSFPDTKCLHTDLVKSRDAIASKNVPRASSFQTIQALT